MVRMADEDRGMMKSVKGKDAYLLQAFFLYVGANRDEGCDEELRIAVFGWPSNSDSAWSAS